VGAAPKTAARAAAGAHGSEWLGAAAASIPQGLVGTQQQQQQQQQQISLWLLLLMVPHFPALQF
jgi:hypothetical protein